MTNTTTTPAREATYDLYFDEEAKSATVTYFKPGAISGPFISQEGGIGSHVEAIMWARKNGFDLTAPFTVGGAYWVAPLVKLAHPTTFVPEVTALIAAREAMAAGR